MLGACRRPVMLGACRGPVMLRALRGAPYVWNGSAGTKLTGRPQGVDNFCGTRSFAPQTVLEIVLSADRFAKCCRLIVPDVRGTPAGAEGKKGPAGVEQKEARKARRGRKARQAWSRRKLGRNQEGA